jgi:hypothetical protein
MSLLLVWSAGQRAPLLFLFGVECGDSFAAFVSLLLFRLARAREARPKQKQKRRSIAALHTKTKAASSRRTPRPKLAPQHFLY